MTSIQPGYCGTQRSGLIEWAKHNNWVFQCDLLQSMAHPFRFHLLWIRDVHILISVPAAPSKTSTVDQNHTSAANCLHVMRAAATGVASGITIQHRDLETSVNCHWQTVQLLTTHVCNMYTNYFVQKYVFLSFLTDRSARQSAVMSFESKWSYIKET